MTVAVYLMSLVPSPKLDTLFTHSIPHGSPVGLGQSMEGVQSLTQGHRSQTAERDLCSGYLASLPSFLGLL